MKDIWFNELRVTGQIDEVGRFRRLARKKRRPLTLGSLYKVPEDQRRRRSAWCAGHWSTKQDVTKAKLHEAYSGLLQYTFLSIDSAPFQWLLKVSKDFPTLNFTIKYCDYIIKVGGTRVFENGQVIKKRGL